MSFFNKNRSYILSFIIVLALSLGLFSNNNYVLDILITTVYFCVMAGAWNIMCGFTGQLSIGHAVFMGLGQYTSTLLFIKLGLSPWIGMFAGAVVAMILAVFIGLLSLRLKTYFFSLATIALAAIIQILVVKFDGLTGGSVGLSIPYKPGFFNMIFKGYGPSYLLFLCLLLAVLLTTAYISKSKLGSNLIAIREDDVAAASLGISLLKNEVIALCISAFFTSIAGTLYAQYTLFIEPVGSFSLVTSLKLAMLSIIGGAGTVFGPLIGGLILGPTEIFLRGWLGSTFQGAYMIIYGALLVLVILFMPNGILGFVGERARSKK